ncbi:hypothetical protein [Gilvibacter sp.]|uniref:hypothetical protein n=1 Tax=Gilvibacter sp. TaxID=2729997 RepID=UPI003F4A4647
MNIRLFISLFLVLGAVSPIIGQISSEIEENIALLLKPGSQEDAVVYIFGQIQENPEELLKHSESLAEHLNKAIETTDFHYGIASLTLELCGSDFFALTPESERSLSSFNADFRKNLRQAEDYHNWIWDDEVYMDARANSCIIMDILGYGTTQASLDELQTSLDYFIDNRPKYFAVSALMLRDEHIDQSHFDSLAEDDETRGLIHRFLKAVSKMRFFPKAYNNQRELSKADMVNWLIYPTELARVPSEIELVEIFTVEYSDVGPADFYLWKFRSDAEGWKEDGWMAGVSGPFVRSETPTMDAYGYTFSSFDQMDEMSPQEHFDGIIELIENWNEMSED